MAGRRCGLNDAVGRAIRLAGGRVLQDFSGTLVTDDFSGYHALAKQGVTPALCMAHARRKLFKVHKLNGSEIARHAVARSSATRWC